MHIFLMLRNTRLDELKMELFKKIKIRDYINFFIQKCKFLNALFLRSVQMWFVEN